MNSTIKRMSWFAVAPILTPAISFISLPILTLRLEAADYGLFGLGIVLASMISGVGSFGLLLYLGGQQLSTEQRHDGIKTAVLGVLLVGLAASVCVVLLWLGVQVWDPDALPIEATMMGFIIIIGLCGVFNGVASDTMVHFGSAQAYSFCIVAHALTFALTAIACTFYWRADPLALYAAGAAGAIVQCVVGLVSLRRHLHGRVSHCGI
jgi:O-antigen/teichoic acid export membrane protein